MNFSKNSKEGNINPLTLYADERGGSQPYFRNFLNYFYNKSSIELLLFAILITNPYPYISIKNQFIYRMLVADSVAPKNITS